VALSPDLLRSRALTSLFLSPVLTGAKEAVQAVLDGSVRYRYVLHNDIE
jgi:hypothetical protein